MPLTRFEDRCCRLFVAPVEEAEESEEVAEEGAKREAPTKTHKKVIRTLRNTNFQQALFTRLVLHVGRPSPSE